MGGAVTFSEPIDGIFDSARDEKIRSDSVDAGICEPKEDLSTICSRKSTTHEPGATSPIASKTESRISSCREVSDDTILDVTDAVRDQKEEGHISVKTATTAVIRRLSTVGSQGSTRSKFVRIGVVSFSSLIAFHHVDQHNWL